MNVTVSELIAELQKMPADARVAVEFRPRQFTYDPVVWLNTVRQNEVEILLWSTPTERQAFYDKYKHLYEQHR